MALAIASGQNELAAALAYAHVEHSRHETLPQVEALAAQRKAEPPGRPDAARAADLH